MKRLQNPIILGDWTTVQDIITDFFELKYKGKELQEEMNLYFKNNKINILFAFYEYISYSGEAFVLFEQNGKLYEVNGSHCSCYGLEGQWVPEETTVEAIKYRLEHGELARSENDYDYTSELVQVLKGLEEVE